MTDHKPIQGQTTSVLSWKMRLAISLRTAIVNFARRPNGTVNRRLLNLIDPKDPPTPIPVDGVKSSDISIDPTRNLWLRLFVPTDDGIVLPVIIFFHGGGFTFHSPDSKIYDQVCRRFARQIPAVIVSVNYRLTPEHRYPAQYDDGFDALKFLDENRTLLPENADLSKCFLAGDSAGGNIAHHVAIRVAATAPMMSVIGLIAIQPFFGGEDRTEPEIRLAESPVVSVSRLDWHWKVFLPEGSDRDHEAANVSKPKSPDSLSGLLNFPKTVVFVGGMDPLQEWQKRYCEWLKRSGKEVELMEYQRMFHGFYVFPELPESSVLFTEVRDFVKKTVTQCLL